MQNSQTQQPGQQPGQQGQQQNQNPDANQKKKPNDDLDESKKRTAEDQTGNGYGALKRNNKKNDGIRKKEK